MPARKYLNETGLASLWTKIVNKINDMGNSLQAQLNNLVNTLSTVAYSGDYTDLTNKPTIPAAQVQSNWNETSTSSKAYIQNKPTIPTKTSQLTNDSNFLVNASTSNYVGKWGNVSADHNTENTTDTWVPVYSNNVLQHRVIKTALNNRDVTHLNSVTYVPYSSTNLVTVNTIAYWNGAYNSTGTSNLTYCKHGAFGRAATATFETYNETNALSSNNMNNLQFLKVVKIGSIVTVNYHFADTNGKTPSNAAWCALKSGLRPNRTIYFVQHAIGNNIDDNCKLMAIYSDGTIKMPNISGSSKVSQCMGSFCFSVS